MGPASIEGYYDEAFSVPGLLEEIRRGEEDGCDGYVIACFDDTGLDAARCVASGPVVGICEAAMHVATLLGGRFSVVTTLARSVPALEALARRYGVADRCRVRAAEVPVLALEDPVPARWPGWRKRFAVHCTRTARSASCWAAPAWRTWPPTSAAASGCR